MLLLGAGAYGALYAYERLSWTTRAKERALKRQYVAFASEKLRYIVHVTAEACAGQARQELISSHRRLRREAERCERVLNEQERDATHEIELLEQLSAEAKYHRCATSFSCNVSLYEYMLVLVVPEFNHHSSIHFYVQKQGKLP